MKNTEHTVPNKMFGCWDRKYIQFGSAQPETDTRVLWLQTPSGMGDMRIRKSRSDMSAYSSLSELSTEQLLELALADCSCGITVLDESAEPMATAEWLDGDSGFAQQVISNYPENGWMEWRDAQSCMMEYAPSGRYEEDWRLLADSVGLCCHLSATCNGISRNYYLAGAYLMLAVDRSDNPKEAVSLAEIVQRHADDRKRVETYLSSEFSYAKVAAPSDSFQFEIELSTLPWREGQMLDMAWFLNAINITTLEEFLSRAAKLQNSVCTDLEGIQWRINSIGFRDDTAS